MQNGPKTVDGGIGNKDGGGHGASTHHKVRGKVQFQPGGGHISRLGGINGYFSIEDTEAAALVILERYAPTPEIIGI